MTALPADAWSSAYAIAAAPLVGSIEHLEEIEQRSVAVADEVAVHPSMQSWLLWMSWSLALEVVHVAPPSTV